MWKTSRVKKLEEEISNHKKLIQKICPHDKGFVYNPNRLVYTCVEVYNVECKVCGKFIKTISYAERLKELQEEARKEFLESQRRTLDSLIKKLEKELNIQSCDELTTFNVNFYDLKQMVKHWGENERNKI
jgi:hypothetical protein